jgi:hypothetical protein
MSYVRVAILGATTGGEVWSINPVFDPTGEFPGSVDQTALDLSAAQIAALTPGTQLLTNMSSLLQITGARVEVRDDATDELIAISVATRVPPLAGTGTAVSPPQSAVVVSLRTNTPGGSGRGRLYWPFIGGGVSSSGRIPTATVTAIVGGMKTYLNAIRGVLATNFPTIGFDTAVRSKLTKTTPHVVRLQCGDVVDTQRRRRDHFPESYQSVPMP